MLDGSGIRVGVVVAIIIQLVSFHGAWAQKNSGPLLPTNPPAYVPSPHPPRPNGPQPDPPSYRATPVAPLSNNPDAERLAQTLPLDPQTLELRDRLPANPADTERRLGLREPHGPATDLRGRTPSPREIVDALAPR